MGLVRKPTVIRLRQKAIEAMPAQSPIETQAARRNWKEFAASSVAIALIAWLCISEHWLQPVRDAINVSRWVNGEVTPRGIAARLVFTWAFDATLFVALGASAVVALHSKLARMKPLAGFFAVLVAGAVIAVMVRSAQLGRWPDFGHLVQPILAFLLGALIGCAVARGRQTIVRLAVQLGVATLIVGGLAILAAQLAIASAPLAFEPPPASEFSKHELANTLRGVRGGEDESRRVRLTEKDLDGLIAFAASRIGPEAKGRVVLDHGSIDAEVSVRLPGGARRFANLRTRGTARIENGRLSMRGEQLSIGSLAVPGFLVRLFSGPVGAALSHDTDLRNMIGSIASLRLEPSAVEVVFKPGECSDTFVPALALAVTGRTSVAAEVRAHVRHLVENSGDLPQGDDRFVELLRRSFVFARERSANSDPVDENRAAILALAILLGDSRVETVVGPVLDEPLREQAQRHLVGTLLRGRSDWTKHFALSAGIVAMACEGVSDRVGVLKELRDADGGSGFSFGDMAANRAGIRLAQSATFNADSARAMQERLAGNVGIADVFPDVSDLPEDMPAAEFQSRFGGVNGAEYQRMIAEIDRRLASCSVLRP